MLASETTMPKTTETPTEEPRAPLDLATVVAEWPTRTLTSGEVLWFADDEADELACVVSGSLEVVVDKHAIGRIDAGQIVGEASAFGAISARTATVRAAGATVVAVCHRRQLAEMRQGARREYALLLDTALKTLAARVRDASARLARLAEGIEERPKAELAGPWPEPSTAMERQLGLHAARLALRTLPVLADADEKTINLIAGQLTSRTLKAGEALCAQGDAGDSVFLVGDGRLDVVLDVGSHRAVTATTIERGAIVGMLSLLLDTPRSASLIAASDCWVLEMKRADHDALVNGASMAWREMLLWALREHITSANGSLGQLEARRKDLLDRRLDHQDTFASLGNSLVWPIREPSRLAAVKAQAAAILHALAPHRRLYPHSGDCAHTPCSDCYAIHRPRVERAVAAGAPIHFILPAFPAKSPNTDSKVLGRLPDMAEEVALRYLQKVCDDIRAVYTPGARVTLCSDGRVFSDLVLVSDDDVTDYGLAIEEMISRLGLLDIDTFNLEDLFEVVTFDDMRDHMAVHYGDNIDQLRSRSKTDRDLRSMVDGIHRFLFEDTLAVRKDLSRSKIRKECRTRAYHVIQRSNAFSRLIAECFPHALRLSIHPQSPHAAKIGILLGHAEGCWITPWHGTVVLTEEGYTLMKRSQAEEMGARLVMRNGQPSHYVMGDLDEAAVEPEVTNAPGPDDWKTLYDHWFGGEIEDSQAWIDGRLPTWFFADPAADEAIRRDFAPWLGTMTADVAKAWMKTPRGALALVLLFDQVPRNAFRGTPAMFAFDTIGRSYARQCLDAGHADALSPIEAFWLYLPFQHHPAVEAQALQADAIHGLADRCLDGHARFFDIACDMATRHRVAIRRFGRFPHRNALLGRASTPLETEFLEDPRNHF